MLALKTCGPEQVRGAWIRLSLGTAMGHSEHVVGSWGQWRFYLYVATCTFPYTVHVFYINIDIYVYTYLSTHMYMYTHCMCVCCTLCIFFEFFPHQVRFIDNTHTCHHFRWLGDGQWWTYLHQTSRVAWIVSICITSGDNTQSTRGTISTLVVMIMSAMLTQDDGLVTQDWLIRECRGTLMNNCL